MILDIFLAFLQEVVEEVGRQVGSAATDGSGADKITRVERWRGGDGVAMEILGLEKGAVGSSWGRAISASCRVVVCSRDLVTAVANVQWRCGGSRVSMFVGVEDGVSVEVLDAWQVHRDVLVEDLAKGHELRLSAVGAAAGHERQVFFKRVFRLLSGGQRGGTEGSSLLHVVFMDIVFEEGAERSHVVNDAGTDLGVVGRSAVELVREGCKETIAWRDESAVDLLHEGRLTIARYLLLVHAHLDQTRPDSLGLSNHAGKLRVECMVSHDCGRPIDRSIGRRQKER